MLLTQSCTAALEVAALLTVNPGDEVIVPAFTFPTTASAFVRCGAVPVFVDIDRATLNIDPTATAAAVTPKTRAIVAVHYAGVGCDIDALQRIASTAGAVLIEDAAHGFGASHAGRPLGVFGTMGALSFHQTKNVISGEGGALVVNDPALAARAQTIVEHGTNRAAFLAGAVSEYSWMELGSSYAPSDMIAAFLLAQIEGADAITAERCALWARYHSAFADLAQKGLVQRPGMPAAAAHNGHIYYLLLADPAQRPGLLARLGSAGVTAAPHFVPLHTSAAGKKYGRVAGSLATTENIAGRLVRLPLHLSMSTDEQDHVIDAVIRAISRQP